MRSLRLSAFGPQLEYQYETCAKQPILGICFERKMVKEVYDLTDAKTRDMLINMGFVFKKREQIQ